jgi:hypothetical protein
MTGSAGRELGARRRGSKALGLTLLLAGGAFLYSCAGLSASYRFRMIVEVDTAAGTQTGSSVMEVTAAKELLPMAHTRPIHVELAGDAVGVDLATAERSWFRCSDRTARTLWRTSSRLHWRPRSGRARVAIVRSVS